MGVTVDSMQYMCSKTYEYRDAIIVSSTRMAPMGAERQFVDVIMEGVVCADNSAYETWTRALFYHTDVDNEF